MLNILKFPNVYFLIVYSSNRCFPIIIFEMSQIRFSALEL